jgi:hypothetical protein
MKKFLKKAKDIDEFTKTMYLYNVRFVTCIVVCSFLVVIFSGEKYLGISDLSVIGYIVTSAFTELGIHTGFMIWKAKFENGRKYKDVNALMELQQEEPVQETPPPAVNIPQTMDAQNNEEAVG